MSVRFMNEVVRISDRLFDAKDPDSIHRQGRLGQVIVAVCIFHVILAIYFIKMEEYEKKHPRVIHDVDVQFEFSAPPPAPEYKVGDTLKAIQLTEGETSDPGSEAAAKARQADKATLPTVKAPETQAVPTPEQAAPVASRVTTAAPPVAVTQTNMVKAAPTFAPKQAPTKLKPSQTAGNLSLAQTSGSATEGGTPDGADGGTGTGGDGAGGEGTGEGDPGAGSGFGQAGGEVATKVDTGTRAMGNIAPYRKGLLMRIATNWQPKGKTRNLVLLVTVGKDGKLLGSEVYESSGSKKADKEALAAIEATEFEALPDWFRGEQLTFKIEMAKVEALK